MWRGALRVPAGSLRCRAADNPLLALYLIVMDSLYDVSQYYKDLILQKSDVTRDFVWSSLNGPSGKFIIAGAVAGLVGAGVVFYKNFYTPLPAGLYPEDRWVVRKIYARNQLAGLLAKYGSKLGFGSPMEINRRLRDKNHNGKWRNPQVVQESLIFDGVPVVLYHDQQFTKEVSSFRELRPAVVHIYGGGWSFCTSGTYETHHRMFVDKLDAVILTVDYSKSPEAPFPVAHEECYKAILHFYHNARDFAVDPARISILGDSAGANIAAGLVIRFRDEGLNFLKHQVLVYPPTQFSNFRTGSYHGSFPLLPRQAMLTMAMLYMRENVKLLPALARNEHACAGILDNPGWKYIAKYTRSIGVPYEQQCGGLIFNGIREKCLNPSLSPLMAQTLKDLPPTLILVCSFDVLQDDGLAYADRLRDEGVEAEVKTFPGTHGSFRYFTELRVGKEMVDLVVRYLRERI